MHLLAPAPFGGLERVVETLATEQASAGHEVHVALILDPGPRHHSILDHLSGSSATTHVIQVGGRAYRDEQRRVGALLAEVRPDVLHTHGYRPAVLHGSIARGRGVATVATAHGFIGGGWKNRLYEFLMRRAFRAYDAVVAVSRPMVDFLAASGVPRDRLHVVQNAWSQGVDFAPATDARRTLGISGEASCIGFVGRVSHEKGVDVLLDALSRMKPQPMIAIVGDGPMRETLTARAAELGVVSHVAWCGAVPNAGRLMKAFDVFVLSSRTEGTPMVLLEAIAAGVPVVATSVGGIPDVVTGSEARLVPPEDAAALAAALTDVLAKPDEAGERAQRALQRLLTEHSGRRWVERYDDVYAAARDLRARGTRRERPVTG